MSVSGLWTIFFSPAETFVPSKRSWLVPLVAACILSLLINVMVINIVGMGTIVRNQLESMPSIAEQLGPEGIDKAVNDAESSGARKIFTYLGALFGVAIAVAIVAGVTYGVFMIMSAGTTYMSVFTACAWSTYAYLVVQLIGSAIFLAAVNDYRGIDPQRLVLLNPSIFLDRETINRFLFSLAGSFDLISFWTLYLQALGIHKLSTGVSMKQSLGVVITLWLIWILGKAGVSTLFG